MLQDKRYKNRELQIMHMLDQHPNVVSLKHCFYSNTEKDELYLNLVLEYVPETVYQVSRHFTRANQRMPLIYVKLYTYQVKNNNPTKYDVINLIDVAILPLILKCAFIYLCRYVGHWRTFMALVFPTGILSHRIFWLVTLRQLGAHAFL